MGSPLDDDDNAFIENLMQLIRKKEISQEQCYAFIIQDYIRNLILEKLANGPISKLDLTNWLINELGRELPSYHNSMTPLEKNYDLLTPLEKNSLIARESFSVGTSSSTEYIFLIRDITILRAPPINVLRILPSVQMPASLKTLYKDECKNLFKHYIISKDDNRILAGYIFDPDKYQIIKVLNFAILTKDELLSQFPREIQNLDLHLKELVDNNIIFTHTDNEKNDWLALKSYIFPFSFFPGYLIDVIKYEWKANLIPADDAIRHLELLQDSYQTSKDPKSE
ncbi:MAG TPA: hypothetical protein VKK79_23760 [Candidatus Lokiarchaeia archaeon]|nr:hypothetical protein [Candidatus Lokiarchaeia archaeon]